MANWAYPGVKCVCVYDGPGKGQPQAAQVLQKGAIYTIVAMALGDGHGGASKDNVDVAVRSETGQDTGPWNVQRFKPLTEAKKPEGMTVLESLLNSKPADLPEDVHEDDKAPAKQDA